MESRGEVAVDAAIASPLSDGPAQYRRTVAHASLGGSHLRLRQHGGVAPLDDVGDRHPARAVVVPVAIVAVVITTSFCVVLPLACARLGATKKGRPRRTGAALVNGDVW